MTLDETLQNELIIQSRKEEHLINVFDKKLEKSNIAFAKANKTFVEIENSLDQLDTEDKNESGRRRKSSGLKSFDFQHVASKATVEDLSQIYEGAKESVEMGIGNFRKGDFVSCVVDRKKSQGTVIAINTKGLIIVTKDRKKIRISWDDIEDEEVQISKVSEEYD